MNLKTSLIKLPSRVHFHVSKVNAHYFALKWVEWLAELCKSRERRLNGKGSIQLSSFVIIGLNKILPAGNTTNYISMLRICNFLLLFQMSYLRWRFYVLRLPFLLVIRGDRVSSKLRHQPWFAKKLIWFFLIGTPGFREWAQFNWRKCLIADIFWIHFNQGTLTKREG